MKLFNKRPPFKLIVPFLLGYLFLGFLLTQMIKNPQQVLATTVALYDTQGYLIIFLLALLEALLFIGFFVPGTAVVMFGATLAAKGVLSLPQVMLCGGLGFVLGSITNYWVGRYGWSRLKIGVPDEIGQLYMNTTRSQLLMLFLAFFSTGASAILSSVAGIRKVPFRRFVLLAGTFHFIWIIIWASIAFLFGLFIVNIVAAFVLFVVLFTIVGVVVNRHAQKR